MDSSGSHQVKASTPSPQSNLRCSPNQEEAETPTIYPPHPNELSITGNDVSPIGLSASRIDGSEHHDSPDTVSSYSQALPLQQTISDLRNRILDLDKICSEVSLGKISSSRFEALERSVQDLQGRLLRVEQAGSQPALSQEQSKEDDALSVLPSASRILITPEKTTFYGPSHWMYTLDQFRLLLCMNPNIPVNQRDPRHREIFALVERCRALKRTIKDQRSNISIDMTFDLRKTFPQKEICDQLVNKYLGTFELVYRILHIPSFWKEYSNYWDQPQTASTRFLVKLGLVLAIGTTFYQDRNQFDSIRSLALQWIYAAQWWLTGPTETKTQNLEGLQIYCLLLLSHQTNSLSVSKLWISSESLLAFAFKLGLHRDPKIFPDMSIFQSEIRRRLWASILEIVVQSSLHSSMPPLISFRDSDCEAPSNIDDDDFDEATQLMPMSKPSSVFTQTSLQIILSKSLRTRYEALCLINEIKSNRSYKMVLQLGSDIKSFYRELTLFFQTFGDVSQSGYYKATKFHQDLIGMIFRRFMLSLHRPFMIQARKDARFYFSRKVVYESSLIILSYVGDLNPSTGLLDDFSRLTALGAGIFKGALSLEAIMALCLEITTQIEEDASRKSNNPISVEIDVLKKVGHAARQPLIQILERTFEQLLHLVTMGNASLKRYVFLSAALSQIKFTEAGEAPERAMRESIRHSLERCCELLQKHLSSTTKTLPGTQVTDKENFHTSAIGTSSFDFDISDLGLMLDTPNSWFSAWDNGNNSF